MDDGFASKAFTKTIQDTSNNTHTGYTPLYTNTFLTIDKRASLSSAQLALDRIWPTSLHIKLLRLHTLTLYGHLHLHLNAATLELS